MAVLGIAMIAGGALSLMYGGGSNSSSPAPQLPSPSYKLGEDLPSYLPDEDLPCEMRLIAADHNLKSCSHSKALLDKVKAQGGLHIQCVPRNLAWNGARYFPHNRTVFIAEDNSDQAMMEMQDPGYATEKMRTTSTLLFEMKNAEQGTKFDGFLQGACHGTIDRDQFKYHVESLEYESGRTHHEISKACVEEAGWDPIIADRFDETKHKTRNFTPEQTQEWLSTSGVG